MQTITKTEVILQNLQEKLDHVKKVQAFFEYMQGHPNFDYVFNFTIMKNLEDHYTNMTLTETEYDKIRHYQGCVKGIKQIRELLETAEEKAVSLTKQILELKDKADARPTHPV